jgi:hypothetical protein
MPRILRSSSSASVRILRLDLVLCCLTCAESAASNMHSERCADTVVGSQFPLTYKGVMLTCCAVGSARPVAAHAAALLQQIIITLCSRARRCDVTSHRPSADTVW